MSEMFEKRLESNLAILQHLEVLAKDNPQARFFQLLYHAGIVESEYDYDSELTHVKDKFHEESVITLENVKRTVQEMGYSE